MNTSNSPELPPQAQMLNLITGYWVSRMIYVVANLGIPDLIKDSALTVGELAERTKVHPQALHRVLRALAGQDIFQEDPDGRFKLTTLGSTLRSDVPASMKAFAIMMVKDYNWESWRDLGWSVETGGVALEKALGMKIFEYYEKHPEDARVFSESMTSISGVENPAVAAAYDFTSIQSLVDVGGGHGSLLSTIMGAFPKLRGVLFDRSQVIQQAKDDKFVNLPTVQGRLECASGDFFESVPAGHDAYIMKYIMHDWNDTLAVSILKNVRKAIKANGKLLVLDCVIPTDNQAHWGKLLDVNMLVLTGGRERTEAEFATLLKDSGFKLTRVIPTKSSLSIVEGTPY